MARYLFVFVLFALKPCSSWHGPGSESCVDTVDSEEQDTTPTSQDGDDASVDVGADASTARDDARVEDAAVDDDTSGDDTIDIDTVDNTPENEGVTDASALD